MRAAACLPLLGMLLSGLLAGCSEPPPETPAVLRIAVVSMAAPPEALAVYGRIAAALETGTGLPVETRFLEGPAEMLHGVRDEGIELAVISGAMFHELRADPGVIALVKPASDRNNATAFVARADDPGQRIADFRGRRMAFGPRESTSGHAAPRRFLLAQSIDPEAYFSEVQHTADHQQTLDAVRERRADLGAVNSVVLAIAREKTEGLRVVWLSPSYASIVIVAHPRLGEDLRQKARDALLALDEPPDAAKTGRIAVTLGRFVPATPADFAIFAEDSADAPGG